MRGYGTYDVPAGSWSDDTSMTLCLLERYDNGNGSLMRIAPIALYLYKQKGANLSWEDLSVVHNISKLTHAHARSLMACGIYVLIAMQLLDGSNMPDAIKSGVI